MNAQEALQMFLALKLHFSTESYDIFKYKGQIKKLPDLAKRKDKFQIQKIARHPDPQGLIIANLIRSPNLWTGDIVSAEGFANYKSWQKRIEALTYTFQEDIKKLNHENLVENFKADDGSHPYALRLYLGDHICLETLVIINSLIDFYSHWDRKLKDDLVWKEIRLVIPKYQPFLKDKYNKDKFKNIFLGRI